jgi:hypothetical protein
VSDTVVVPADLQDEYEALRSGTADFSAEENLFNIPLAYRRAGVYLSFSEGIVGQTDLLLGTSGAPFATLEARVESAARSLGLSVEDVTNYEELGSPELGADFLLVTGEARTRGELAWLGDRLLQSNPQLFEFVEANAAWVPGA